MRTAVKISLLCLTLLGSTLCAQQDSDTLRYRSTSFHISAAQFVLVAPQYPQIGGLFPAASLSLKSARTDSTYIPLSKSCFSIMMGAAASRYLFYDKKYFANFVDKDPYHVFSKRFWGGFGMNYRERLSRNFFFDVDVAPCLLIIVDKSEETKADTSGWNSVGFDRIYQGLHLNAYCKLEYNTGRDYSFFATVSGSVPLTHKLVNHGDEPYLNTFRGQIFAGLGLTYVYRSRHIVEPNDRNTPKK